MKAFFVKTWEILNFSRRLVLNLLFLILIIALIVSIASDGDEIVVPEKAALVVDIKGNLVEQKRWVDPVESALNESMGAQNEAETLLDDVLYAIKTATKDDNIQAIYLDLSKMRGAHINKLDMVGDALEAFKAKGKKVVAMNGYYSQTQYYLATFADELYLHPYGGVMIDGYGVYPMYMKDALDKLKITQHIFRVGTYKSAVEPFMRNDMSEAAKEANREWLMALWQQYKERVAKNRAFDIANFDETGDALLAKLEAVDGDLGLYSLNNNWVDALKTRKEVHDLMIEYVGKSEDGKSFSHIAMNDYLKLKQLPKGFVNPITEKVAVIVAKGTIVDGSRKAGQIGGDSTAALLRKARLDDKVKAVVLRIDSGGGSAFASEIIRQEVLAIKAAGKPIIASMSSVAASGGYWIAAHANEIWAAPSTITGSIGIFGAFMTFENSLDYLGLNTDGVGTTEFAGLSQTRKLPESFAQMIQMNIENGYDRFLTVVSEGRGLSKEAVNDVAQGRVWIATQAKEFGLVDELGNKQDAIKRAAELASLDYYDVWTVEQDLTPQERLIQELFSAEVVQSFFKQDGTASYRGLADKAFDGMSTLTQQMQFISEFNDPDGAYIRCLECKISL